MKVDTWLVITRKGLVRLVKRPPRVQQSEIAVRLRIEVPDRVFDRLIPTADLKIPEEAILKGMAPLGVEVLDTP